MLKQLERIQAALGGIDNTIDRWLQARKHLLVTYCHLAGLSPFNQPNNPLPEAAEVIDFCDILVDYVSSGHFEMYDKLLMETQSLGQRAVDKAHTLYPQIRQTTDTVLRFYDRYEQNPGSMDQLDRDLSTLGEALMERFELEDRLLEQVADAKRPSPTDIT